MLAGPRSAVPERLLLLRRLADLGAVATRCGAGSVGTMDQAARTGSGLSRADAVRNRAAILEAASAAFAEQGSGVDVREIARCAGVGMGTLYRHFATKEVLLQTVLHEHFAEWTRTALQTAEGADPATALRAFLADALERQAAHRALVEQFAEAWGTAEGVAACSRELHPLIDDLVARCHRVGALRPGVTGEDVALLLIGLGRVAQLAGEQDRPLLWRRALQVALDGLQPVHREQLPGDARSPQDGGQSHQAGPAPG